MTGLLTDVGVLLGHQIGRQLHRLLLWTRGQHDSAERRAVTRKNMRDERTQLKLLCARARVRAACRDCMVVMATDAAIGFHPRMAADGCR